MSDPRPNRGVLGEAMARLRHGDEFEPRAADARTMLSRVPPEQVEALENELEGELLSAAIEVARHVRGPLDPEVAVDAVRAAAEVSALKGDSQFMDRYQGGDPRAQAKFGAALERAYPDREED